MAEISIRTEMTSNFCGGSSRLTRSHHNQYNKHLILAAQFSVLLLLLLLQLAVTASGRDINGGIEPDTNDMSAIFSRDELVDMAGYGEDKLSTVLITGTVVCKRSRRQGTQKLRVDDYSYLPVSGAIVAATCRNDDARNEAAAAAPLRWVKAVTDINGEFTIDLPSHLHAIPDIDKACSLKIQSIPKNKYPCQPAITDVSKGLQLSFSGNGIRTYSAGTIEFMPRSVKAED